MDANTPWFHYYYASLQTVAHSFQVGPQLSNGTLQVALESLQMMFNMLSHSTKKPITTMLTYPWKCTVLHCNHLGNTWKPLVLMTRRFDYCPSAGDNQSYNVKLYIFRGRLAWWLLAFLHSVSEQRTDKVLL